MASVGKDIYESSTGVMSIFTVDIMDTPISSDSSILGNTDSVYDEWNLPSMNFSGVPVGPTVTFD